jgi:Holliday junction resolvasome RuvABC ATP-dependent DNA helicase subunit
MTNKTPFANLVGQEKIKSLLAFHLETREAGKPLPHILFTGFFGGGKTAFIRSFAKEITQSGTTGKYLEINSSTCKSIQWFIDNVYMPHIVDRDNVCLLWDEAHELPRSVQTWFLTLLNTEKSHIRRVNYDGTDYEFDFCKLSMNFATTDPNKLGKPLKSRMEVIALAPYSTAELMEIIRLNVPDIEFEDNVLEELVGSIKPNPRAAAEMARKVGNFCAIKKRKSFDSADFANLSNMVDIKVHGLDNTEISVLKLLDERGPMTLTEISACLSIPATALRQDHEHHLLRKGFLKLDGKRHITNRGKEVIKTIKG